MRKIDGAKLLKELDPDERVVSMIEHQGNIYVATSWHVWQYDGQVLREIVFVPQQASAP